MKLKHLLSRRSAAPAAWVGFTLFTLLSVASAQNLNQVMPEPVPPQVDAPAPPAPPPMSIEDFKRTVVGAGEGETVLLASLQGVVFLKDETQLNTMPLAPGQVSNLADRPELATDEMRGIVDLFVGEAVSKESLLRLRTAIGLSLAGSGRPFSIVYTPPQDITDGILQLVVRQSELTAVRVEGAKYFSTDQYISRIGQTPGHAIDATALSTGIDRINRNAFRQAAVRAERGATPGTTDLVVQVKERFPVRVFGGYSNTGSHVTTEDRVNAGVNWGNAFGLGHLMTLQWTSDLEARYSRSVSGNYSADTWGDQSFTFFGAYSQIESVPNGGISQDGLSWQAGINYDIPLRDIGKHYTHSLQFGTDFKVSDNNLEYADPPYLFPISDNLTQIVQARVSYNGTLSDRLGATSWGVRLTGSPGGLSAENNDVAFHDSRWGARATYAYASLNFLRQTRLPESWGGWTWTLRGEMQMATTNLLGSEQFSGGGVGSVRGYEQGEVVGDNALFSSQELVSPAFSLLHRVIGGDRRDSMQVFGFQDYARLWSVDKLPGERPFDLLSVGAGLRYQLGSHGSVRAAYGWQLRDSGSSDTGKNSRLHFSANLSF